MLLEMMQERMNLNLANGNSNSNSNNYYEEGAFGQEDNLINHNNNSQVS